MTTEQIDALVARYLEDWRRNPEEDFSNLGELTPEVARERQRFLRDELGQAREALAFNRLEAAEHDARWLLFDSGEKLPDEAAYRRLLFRLLTARVDVLRDQVARLPELPPAPATVATAAPEVPEGPKVSELVKAYLTHRDASDPFRPNTRIEAVSAFSTLADLLGDPPLATVRNRDAQDYALKLSRLPKRWRQRFRGKAASEVLRTAGDGDYSRIEPATFNKELGLVKAFWRWACSREELSRNALGAVSPADAGSAKDKRRPFSEDEMQALAPIVQSQRVARPERFWVVTLLAYTGARLEEIAQLRKQDVLQVGKIWCVRITGEAGSVKSAASERLVPIHSTVIARGFLEFVKSAAGDRLFAADDRVAKSGQPISKWFGRQLTALKVSDRAKKGLHSFRHVMRDRLRLAGADPVTRREILGHAHQDVEDQVYGDPTTMEERRAALERVALPL